MADFAYRVFALLVVSLFSWVIVFKVDLVTAFFGSVLGLLFGVFCSLLVELWWLPA